MPQTWECVFNQRKGVGLKHCNDFQTFIEYLSDMGDIYENIEELNPNKDHQNVDHIWWHDSWYT